VIDLPPGIPTEFFRPLVSGWVGKLESADKSRARWREVADECGMFVNRSAAAMWDPQYQKKFWRGVEAPKFRITLNLAYEYVAVFGPNLFWECPHRQVTPKRPIPITPDIFQGLAQAEWIGMIQQQFEQQQAQSYAQDRVVAFLMEDWLNYSAGETNLEDGSELAVVDALIKGRGCLVSRPYTFPGSGRVMTKSAHLPPEELLIDPDFRSLENAQWIAIKHIEPHWKAERRFQLPEGSLKDKASLESTWAYGESQGAFMAGERAAGQTNDLVVWWEIWSKTGVGGRLTGMDESIKRHLQGVVGDYAYLAISPNVPYPLNCPASVLRQGASEDEVRQRFSWPIPVWTDNAWPIQVLDFYPNTDISDPSAAWPIPPLSPALGEIKFLNFIIPWLTNRIWSSSRDFWAVAGAHYDELLKNLQEGGDQTVIPVPHGAEDVRKVVQMIQQPETRADVWRIVELVTDLFRRRTGLVDFAYGKNEGGTQNRTAEETIAKARAVGTRPEHMQKKVVQWQSKLAATEAFVTRLFVKGTDVEDRYGPVGRWLWETFIMSTNVELVVRQMQYSIAASSIRRPNRDRDIANLMQVFQHWMSLVQQYGTQTGDYTPANGMMELWGDLHDMDVDKIYIPPPQEDDEAKQMQQAQMQLEMQKLQADIEKSKMDLQGKMIDAEAKKIDAQVKQATGGIDIMGKQLDLEFDQARSTQDLQRDRVQHILDLLQNQQQFEQKLGQQERLGQLKIQQARVAAKAKPQTNGSK